MAEAANYRLKIHSKADLDLINVAHLATFAADCTEASENYYQQGINFAADLQFLVNAVESTVTSLDEVSDLRPIFSTRPGIHAPLQGAPSVNPWDR